MLEARDARGVANAATNAARMSQSDICAREIISRATGLAN